MMRPFILLELLIALTLFILCTPLFINEPLLLLNKESLSLEKMEIQRIAENSFAEIKSKLYMQEIEWKKFSGSKKDTPFIETEEPIKILSRKYKQKYKIWTINEKEEAPKIFRRVGIEIVIAPAAAARKGKSPSFLYEVFAISTPKEKSV